MEQIHTSNSYNNKPMSKEKTNTTSRHGNSYQLKYGPLAHVNTAQTTAPPFAGELQQEWFIFTFLLTLCTVKSTVVFFSLFVAVDFAILLAEIGYFHHNALDAPNTPGYQNYRCVFAAWWVMLAGIADSSYSFFIMPVFHFPWLKKGRASRGNKEN